MPQNKGKRNSTTRQKRGHQGSPPRRFPVTAVGAVAFLAFTAALYAVMTTGQPPLGVELGGTSPRTFTARTAFSRTDLDATRAARRHARLQEPTVWRYSPGRWERSSSELMQAIRTGGRSIIWQRLPEGFEREAFRKLLPALRERIEPIRQALEALGERPVAAPGDLDDPALQEKLTRQVLLRSPGSEPQSMPLDRLIPLAAESRELREALAPALEGMEPGERNLAVAAFAAVLEPACSLDPERTARRARRAAEAAEPVTEQVEDGQVLLAQGSEVRKQHLMDLHRERAAYRGSEAGRVVRIQRHGGMAVFLLLVVGGAAVYVRLFRPQLFQRRPQVLSFALLTLLLVGLARLCVVWGASSLWVPLPLMVMIMCLVYDQRFGLGTAVFFALLVRLAYPGANVGFLVLLVGGVMAALLSEEVRTRSTLIKAGLLTGAVQFAAVWGLDLMGAMEESTVHLQFWESPLLARSLIGFANGVLSGFIVSGVLPAIEKLFGVTTEIRLLEWSDPNQPLLQRLLVDAPGSYHHSMIVGSLAADAAEAIGASPLLARVSAYFHDVGKLKKPEYFAENLASGQQNPHEELSPTMSSLIITAHPKDGAEMAEQYGVPRVVRDIILQSHGSSVLQYFWEKARREETERDQAQERTFRYRLPKPHSKEAAVVMLCDAVESATRSMESPSVGQLENLVHSIVLDRFHDGQLDDSGLSITDLKTLEDTLVRGLTAVFHNRISYPGQEEARKRMEQEEPHAVAAGTPVEETEGDATGSQ